jgi:hypothetical protein
LPSSHCFMNVRQYRLYDKTNYQKNEKGIFQCWDVAQWYSACLACKRPQVPSPGLRMKGRHFFFF